MKRHLIFDFTLEPRMLLATLQAAIDVFRPVPLPGPQASAAISIGIDRSTIGAVAYVKLVNPAISDDGFAAGAVALADLNGDGILDMAVANSLNNSVNVYLGLGNGQFTQDLNGGDGFATGRGPVGVSVADINGDGRADLIVADEGSNEVSLLLNSPAASDAPGPGLPGQSVTFASAAPLNVGMNPTSAVVVNDPEGESYLAVGDSGSHDVMIFTFAGNGILNSSPSQVIPVGQSPSLVVPMNWNGGPALVSLDCGENFITLITGLGEPHPQVQTVDSGGLHPVAAQGFAAGSANGLLVANSGDGSVVLFTEDSDGLAMRSKFFSPMVQTMATPSLAGVRELGVLVFTAGSSAGSSTLIGFRLVGQTPNPNSDALIVLNPQQQLQPLRQSDLALVSTLLPVSVEVTPALTGSTTALPASFASSDGVTTAITPPGRGNGSDLDSVVASGGVFSAEGAFSPMTELTAASAPAPTVSRWENYVSGVDTAIERIHQEALERAVTSPSALEAKAAPLRAAGGEITKALNLGSLDVFVPAITSASFEPIALVAVPPAESMEIQSGPASNSGAPDVECGAAVLDQGEASLLEPPGDRSPTESNDSRSGPTSISVVLAVATIAPIALRKWLRSIVNLRVRPRIRRKSDHAVST
jgi:FG-GAP-like repeat